MARFRDAKAPREETAVQGWTSVPVARDGVKGPKNGNQVAAASAVLNFPVDYAIGSQLFARLAEMSRWFLSNRRAKNLFIVSALVPNHVPTIESFNVETFPGLSAWEGFLLLGGGERGSR